MKMEEQFDSDIDKGIYKAIRTVLEEEEMQWFDKEKRLESITIDKISDERQQIKWCIKVGVSNSLRTLGKNLSIDNYNLPKTLVISKDRFDGNLLMDFDLALPFEIDVVPVSEKKFYGLSIHEKRPIIGGTSAAHYDTKLTGTLGCKITLKNDKARYIISNWHVFVNSNGDLGDRIMQPSRQDMGNTNDHSIAELIWYRLDCHMDAAIAKVYDDKLIKSGTISQLKMGSLIQPKPNMPVKKQGRSTQNTEGKIIGFVCRQKVTHPEYPNGVKYFKDQIKMNLKAQEGDSGSIITSREGDIIGLLFAGDLGNYCLANWLDFSKEISEGEEKFIDAKYQNPTIVDYN